MYPPVLSPKLQQIRSQINTLTPQERQALLQTLLADPLPAPPTASETAEEAPVIRVFVPVTPTPLASVGLPQGKRFTKLEDYVADWWSEEETADDINDFIYQMRQADLVLEQMNEI
jgi:type II secretory pathway component PulL